MPLLVALAVLLLPAAAVASGGPSPAAAEPQRAGICTGPSLVYRGAPYRVVQLVRHRLELGLRLRRPISRATGVLTDHRGCNDAVPCVPGGPCEPPPQPPPLISEVRVLRLTGISPAVALAAQNPRLLYVAASTCGDAGSWTRLARCLKRAKPPRAASSTLAVDRAWIVAALRARGLAMTPVAMFTDVFFGRERHAYSDNISIVEFATEAEAVSEAGRLSGDGDMYAGVDRIVIVYWIAPPHFFRGGRAIVLYVGSDATILSILGSTLGEQFAGR